MRIDIDAKEFSTIDEFFIQVELHLTNEPEADFSHDFIGFEDVLMGGFGIHDFEEPLKIVWKNSEKSRKELNYKATVAYLEELLDSKNGKSTELEKDLKKAKKNEGLTLFDMICDIANDLENVELLLK